MDLTVLYLAVPSLTAELEPSSAELLWITDVYGFFLAGFLITMGTLGDRVGRRRLLLIGAAAFGAASLLAAFSKSVEMLIVARALLGVAAATLAPSTLSLIRNMFLDPKERTPRPGSGPRATRPGPPSGPLVGGVLLEFFWWGSVFLLAVPVMVLLLGSARGSCPSSAIRRRSPRPLERRPVDRRGARSDLRAEGVAAEGPRQTAVLSTLAGSCRGRLRSPAADARVSADRPEPVPVPWFTPPWRPTP